MSTPDNHSSTLNVSMVIPVYNEAESLRELVDQIDAVMQRELSEMSYECILIDDGSRDGSWDVITELSRERPHCRGIRFRRNFAKAAALEAGVHAARGEFVITLDADLQDDPAEIPSFLAMMNDYDVVSGWKKVRHDPWHKVIPSRFFNAMVSFLTGVHLHDHNCGMKCYRRTVFDEVHLYGERHRFVPVLAASRGFRVGEKVIAHRARQFGYSKYGFTRFVKGFLDLLTIAFLTGYGRRPQHLAGTVGLVSFGIGATTLTLLAAAWIVTRLIPGAEHLELHNRPLVLYSVALMLFGGQLVATGILAELLIAQQYTPKRGFSISETTDA
ncbi:MAG: glycosyltransferase family 2 protein [Thermoguttaceae bacterium]